MRRLTFALLLLCPLYPASFAQDDDGIITDEDPIAEEEEDEEEEPARRTPPLEPPPKAERPKPPPEAKPPKASLPQRINVAIDEGVAWLKARADEDGAYGPCVARGSYDGSREGESECYRIGPTAFAVFTLRKCGVPRKDRGLRRSFRWLKKRCREHWTPDLPRPAAQFAGKGVYRYTSYEAAAVIMMLVQLNRKDLRSGEKAEPARMSREPRKRARGWKRDDWEWMHQLVQYLIENPHSRQPAIQLKNGGWRYWPPYKKADQDLSATQFALLGLRAAVSAGYPVHMVQPETWSWAANAARSFQLADGAFRYQRDSAWTSGMTAAGIACLLICKEQIANLDRPVPSWLDARVETGLDFLGKNLDFTQNTRGEEGRQHAAYHYYHLYGIERVGALSGKREIGGQAWYPRGAAWLVEQQRDDGAWVDATCMRPCDVLGTCFALLFLKKATMPVVTVSGG